MTLLTCCLACVILGGCVGFWFGVRNEDPPTPRRRVPSEREWLADFERRVAPYTTIYTLHDGIARYSDISEFCGRVVSEEET